MIATMIVTLAAGLLIPSSVVAQFVLTATPERVVLGGTVQQADILISGRTFGFTAARVVDRGGGAVQGIEARLGRNTGRQLPVTLSADGARAGTYGLELVSARGATRVNVAIAVEAELVVRAPRGERVVSSNAAPLVESVQAPETVPAGTPFDVVVTASDDRGVAELGVTWSGGGYWPGGDVRIPIGGATQVTESVAIENLEPGTHDITVRAVDADGSASGDFLVTVEAVELSLGALVLDGYPGVARVPTHVPNTIDATVDINVEAPTGGLLLEVAPSANCVINDPTAVCLGIQAFDLPASVSIAPGSRQADFSIRTRAVDLGVPSSANAFEGAVTIQVTAPNVRWPPAGLWPGGGQVWLESPPRVDVVYNSHAGSVQGGGSVSWSVLLAHSDGTREDLLAPLELQVSSSDPTVASVPSTITVPTGTSGAALPIQTTAVTEVTTVTITVTDGRETRTATLTVNP